MTRPSKNDHGFIRVSFQHVENGVVTAEFQIAHAVSGTPARAIGESLQRLVEAICASHGLSQFEVFAVLTGGKP